MKALVVGGGAMGLSCGIALLERGLKHVTIVAEQWSPDTTSDGAGTVRADDIVFLQFVIR